MKILNIDDVLFSEDLIKVFFMIGDDISSNGIIEVDLNKKSQFGFIYITLYSEIQKNLPTRLSDYKYFSVQLDESIRPSPEGDRKCNSFETPSSAKYLIGFLPKITGKFVKVGK